MRAIRRSAAWRGLASVGAPVLALALASCAPATIEGSDPWVAPVFLTGIGPSIVLPGTTIRMEGDGFLDPMYGTNAVHWVGNARNGRFDEVFEARFVDAKHLELDVTDALFRTLGGDGGGFAGAVRIEVENKRAGSSRASEPIKYEAAVAQELRPTITALDSATSIYVNDPVQIEGDGFLLGGGEGTTFARVGGCFYPTDAPGCIAVETLEIPVEPETPTTRTRGAFTYSFKLSGIRPGLFRGSLEIVNRHGDAAGGVTYITPPSQIELTIAPSRITELGSNSASLGQFVDIRGGGFVGGDDSALTLLEVSGDFTSNDSGNTRAIDVVLVPEYVSGRHVRYVMNEEDGLGQEINLRRESGHFSGKARLVTRYGEEERTADEVPLSFEIAPLRQMVTVVFLPSYVESLGRFGLRAVDDLVREQTLRTAMTPYVGVNLQFIPELPEDFALYSVVEISGKDPNNQGLFGYDNTPGKDTNNLRLTDRIGGVNAQTQQDNYPGYGGVFIESFFEFGHGGEIAEPLFDQIFDPFRPARGGTPVNANDLTRGVPEVTDGRDCAQKLRARPNQIACAVWVLGNVIGSTLSHEVGHSLGLANPYDPNEFHNLGDQPLRLMDSGGSRPFAERADVEGNGTAVFCQEEYEYLREIMPSGDADERDRPICF